MFLFTELLSSNLSVILFLAEFLYLSICVDVHELLIYVHWNCLKFFPFTVCSENDKAHIRLAAAKAILRLARKWDLHITPEIFHLTILIAKVCILPCVHLNNSAGWESRLTLHFIIVSNDGSRSRILEKPNKAITMVKLEKREQLSEYYSWTISHPQKYLHNIGLVATFLS